MTDIEKQFSSQQMSKIYTLAAQKLAAQSNKDYSIEEIVAAGEEAGFPHELVRNAVEEVVKHQQLEEVDIYQKSKNTTFKPLAFNLKHWVSEKWYFFCNSELCSVLVFMSAIFLAALAITLVLPEEIKSNNYNKCKRSLRSVAAASTVELAREKLSEAIASDNCHQAIARDRKREGIWGQNIEAQLKELKQVSPSATPQEKYFALKQLRETLLEADYDNSSQDI